MANIRLVPEEDLNDPESVAGGILAGMFAPRQSRGTVSVISASLAGNAEWTGTIPLGKSYRMISILTDRPCRVRIYSTAAKRIADASRPIGTDPTGTHGVLLEYVSISDTLGGPLSPIVDGSNLETTPTINASISIQNLSGATSTVRVDIVRFVTE